MVKHLLTVADLSPGEARLLLATAQQIKATPEKFHTKLHGKTMLMLFEKPSLRTRVSFETGMTELGGHAIFYSVADSPLGKKENIHDTAKCLTEYVDIIMARLKSREVLRELAEHSDIPVLNGLDDYAHPCQILSDAFTILESRGTLQGVRMAYLGDCHNNVTYDLMRLAALLGFECVVGCPAGKEFSPEESVLRECEEIAKIGGGKVRVVHDAKEAVSGVDVVYTDSWMSYHIPAEEQERRKRELSPFRVTTDLMNLAKSDAIFMNCLPAARGMEQDALVIDGPRSVVFTQAGNRLHMQKAIMMYFLGVLAPTPPSFRKVLVALGGNALLQPGERGAYEDQSKHCQETADQLAELIARGHQLAITHGNGPQVGAIHLQNEIAQEKVPPMPLAVEGAESQGLIGYMMVQGMRKALQACHLEATANKIAAVVTQALVDKDDPAFQNPTKPIGRFYNAEEAKDLRAKGYSVVEDSGRGYRVVVPSPDPKQLIEGEAIRSLFDSGFLVVASGGGGIPVCADAEGVLHGLAAVIDKDLAGERMASLLGVDLFLILTDVECAYLDFKKESQRPIREMSSREAMEHLQAGHFGKGSMGPKILAAARFAEATGKVACITSLTKVLAAIEGRAGTRVHA